MKQVRETSNVSAYIVLNKKSEVVANVQFKYGTGGGVQCDVWSREPGKKFLSLTHQKRVGGYGYDKKTASLAGAIIEGYQLADHCRRVEETGEKKRERLMRAYLKAVKAGEMSRDDNAAFEEKARRIGCRFANWNTPSVGLPHAWGSLHNESGLARLEMLGFRVIQAV